jgi:CDP-glycerol glycerophosphotransferase (TagB/SpsB family)
MHEEYVAYAQRLKLLMTKHPDWKWVIKMHPLEKNKDQYIELVKDGFEIIDREKSLTALLKESSIQISIYSTTFFDALGFSIENYSLQDY